MKEVIITSSALIVAILLVRWLLRNKVSQRLIYATWLLVALRLLIPIQIGQVPFSLLSATQPVAESIAEISDKQIAGVTDQDAYRQVLQEYIENDRSVFTPSLQDRIQFEINRETPKEEIAVIIDKVYTEQEVFIPQAQPQVQEKVEATADPITLAQILKGIWLAGICVMGTWFLTANLLFLHRAKMDAVSGEDNGIRYQISPHVPTPCVAGLFRPVIYLTPACAENEQTRAHVLAHEGAHLRHGDHIWALVRCLCLCIHWFNPLVWIAASQSRRDCELACDESALKELGDADRIAYGKTLLDIVSQSMSPVHLLETATAMNESKKQLTERVNYIVKTPRNILIAAIFLILVAAITAGCAFMGASPIQPAGPTSSTTQPTDPSNPTDPTKPTDPGNDVPIVPDSPQAQTAEELVNRYTWYMAAGLCCDFELDSQDLSAYLTDSQKQDYYSQQYSITCCHTPDEFEAHIDRTLAKELQVWGDPADRLFTDGNGQLYLIITPTGMVSYRNASTVEAGGILYAKTGAYDEDGWFADAYFTIENGLITRVARTDTQGIPAYAEGLDFPLHAGTLFDKSDSWYLRALTSDYTDPKNANIARFFNLGFSDEKPITDEEWSELRDIPDFRRNEKLHRLPAERMDETLTQVFGLTLSQMNGIGLEKLTYLESTGCYYLMEGQDALWELHFSQSPSQGNNLYTNGSTGWYVYITATKNGPKIQQNSMTYTHQVRQTTQLAKEYLGMTRLEFLYTSTLMLQEKMKAQGWSEKDMESVYWNAHSIANRSLYLEDSVLMMKAQYSSLAAPEDPLRKTLYIPYTSPQVPADLEAQSYLWLFKMEGHVDGYVADAYATLLLDCVFVEPDTFLQYLAEFDKETIRMCQGLMYYGIVSQEDADLFSKLLTALSARSDLNDRERQALEILTQVPEYFPYSTSGVAG